MSHSPPGTPPTEVCAPCSSEMDVALQHPFQLKPLAEMEVVGACRRGRRRGRRNRTAAERQSEMEQRRRSKNARERQRVENVKTEYAKLQKLLGFDSGFIDNKSKEKRRHCKLRVLTAAVERIRTLMETLRQADDVTAGSQPRLHTTQQTNKEEKRADFTTLSHNSNHPMPCAPNYRPGSLHTHNGDALRPIFCPSPYPTPPFNHPIATPNPLTPFFTVLPHHVSHLDHPPHCSRHPLPRDPGSHHTAFGPHGFPYPPLQVCGQPVPYTDHWPHFQPPYSNTPHTHNYTTMTPPKLTQDYISLPSLALSSPC